MKIKKYDTETVWNIFGDKLKYYIQSKINDKNVAEDLLQDVFIKVHSKIDTLKDNTKIHSWLYQITRNLIIDYYRINSKKLPYNVTLEEENVSGNDSLERMQNISRDLVMLMEELPEKYCEALCMTEFDGLSQKEYAKKIGISYSGAKSRVQRAKIILKDILMKCCHFQFDKYGTIIESYPVTCCCCCNEN